jgi:hypothetical protein
VKLARLGGQLHSPIVKGQVIRPDREFDAAAFARPQPDSLEPLQLPDRTGHAAHEVADVQLHDFVGLDIAGIPDDRPHRDGFTERQLAAADLDVRVAEPGVGQPVAERVLGREPASRCEDTQP